MEKKHSKEETAIRNELNEYYKKGCPAVKEFTKDQLSKKPSNQYSYEELCEILDSIRKIQTTEEIKAIDGELEKINEQELLLKERKAKLFDDRYKKFSECDDVQIYYEIDPKARLNRCKIFLCHEEDKEIIYEGDCDNEEPYCWEIEKCPEKFRADFKMVWNQARKTIADLKKVKEEDERREQEERKRRFEEECQQNEKRWKEAWSRLSWFGTNSANANVEMIPKDIRRKFYHILVKQVHPDSNTGCDSGMMNYVMQMKKVLQI